MLDASFRSKSLFEVVRDGRDQTDFSLTADALDVCVRNALTRARSGGTCFLLNTTQRNGRDISVPRDYETTILLRRLNENVRRITKVRQSDRHYVVSCLKQLCENGLPFVVAKYDISKFFASINTNVLRKECHDRLKSSGATNAMLNKFFVDLKSANIAGVPAGLALSGTLSEIFLAKLDRAISRSEGVHFYSRYVDDIIIVGASHLTDAILDDRVLNSLPEGLSINLDLKKKSHLSLSKRKSKGSQAASSFDYLGYNLKISDVSAESNHDKTLTARKVTVDISRSKIDKRKTRFVLSIKQYLRDGNQDDLMDRFLLINSGYQFYDRNSGRWLSSGMCNSYPLIDFPSNGLNELAIFYRGIFSDATSSISARLALAPLSRRNRKRIQYFDLNRHVREKKYVGFSEQRLTHLMRCWRGA